MSRREDLLALDESALVTLANRGLFKRASKSLAQSPPALTLHPDGTLEARFEDAEVRWARGQGMGDSACSCGAPKACRHRVGAVLAYQADTHDGAEETVAPDGPPPLPEAEVVQRELKARLGKRAFQAAERSLARGLSATVRCSSAPEVLLPTCTVTFFVPWELSHARCDCRVGRDCEHVALALWALQSAGLEPGERRVELRAEGAEPEAFLEAEALSELVRDILRTGTESLDGLQARTDALLARLRKHRRVWIVDLVEALQERLAASARGELGADVGAVAALLTEAEARARSQPGPEFPASELYGDASVGGTKLEHVVLRGLGARYRVQGRTATLELLFREGESADPLVLQRSWVSESDGPAVPGPVLAQRRWVGASIDVLAGGNITSRGVVRHPNRRIEVSSQRLSTSVGRGEGPRPGTDTRSTAELYAALSARPPAEVSARSRTSSIVVVDPGEVRALGYDPGRRALWCLLGDPDCPALLVSEWRPEAPGGPAAVARALRSEPKAVVAEARLRGARLELTPLGLTSAEGFVCPDLAPEAPLPDLQALPVPEHEDPLGAFIEGVDARLADLVPSGLRNISGRQLEAVAALATQAEAAGLERVRDGLRRLLDDEGREQAWLDLMLHLALCRHLLTH